MFPKTVHVPLDILSLLPYCSKPLGDSNAHAELMNILSQKRIVIVTWLFQSPSPWKILLTTLQITWVRSANVWIHLFQELVISKKSPNTKSSTCTQCISLKIAARVPPILWFQQLRLNTPSLQLRCLLQWSYSKRVEGMLPNCWGPSIANDRIYL